MYVGAFGRDPFIAHDLNQIELHGVRGYFSENSFLGILLPASCKLICTCPRGLWLAFSTETVGGGGQQNLHAERGHDDPGCFGKTVKSKRSGNYAGDDGVSHATDTAKLFFSLPQLTKDLPWISLRQPIILVPFGRTIDGHWFNLRLRLSSQLQLLRAEGKKKLRSMYYGLFSLLPVIMVTVFQGHREWHIARKFSLTSTTSHVLVKALLHNDMDLEFDCVCHVCEYMCKNYDYEKRVSRGTRAT